MSTLKETFNNHDHFARANGITITHVDAEKAIGEMTVSTRHLNAAQVCQGGALFTLADTAMAVLANNNGKLTFSAQSSIHFMIPAKLGDRLTALALLLVPHHRLPLMQVTITNQHGETVAVLMGQGYRKEQDIPCETLQ